MILDLQWYCSNERIGRQNKADDFAGAQRKAKSGFKDEYEEN